MYIYERIMLWNVHWQKSIRLQNFMIMKNAKTVMIKKYME